MKHLPVIVILTMLTACHSQPEQSQDKVTPEPEQETRAVITSAAQVKPSIQEIDGRDQMPQPLIQSTELTGQLFVEDALTTRGNTLIKLKVSNPQHYGVPIEYRSGMSADLSLVTSTGQDIWTWSHDMMFTQAIRNTYIAAGESITVSFEVPASVMARVKPGYQWQATYKGRNTESPKPLLNTISLTVK